MLTVYTLSRLFARAFYFKKEKVNRVLIESSNTRLENIFRVSCLDQDSSPGTSSIRVCPPWEQSLPSPPRPASSLCHSSIRLARGLVRYKIKRGGEQASGTSLEPLGFRATESLLGRHYRYNTRKEMWLLPWSPWNCSQHCQRGFHSGHFSCKMISQGKRKVSETAQRGEKKALCLGNLSHRTQSWK